MGHLLRFIVRSLFRVRVTGLQQLPATGPFILAGVPHRNWLEPVLVHAVLAPGERRLVTVADARTVRGAWWREAAAELVGGVIAVGGGTPTGPGPSIAAATAYLASGAILIIFPETGQPSRPPRLRRLSTGVARIAAASSAPVVPVVFGGTEQLYLGRRIEVRVLPPVPPPPADADRAEIAAWMASFRGVAQSTAALAEQAAGLRPPRVKLWRWLSGNYPRVPE